MVQASVRTAVIEAIGSQLAEYDYGDAIGPAVFMAETVPADAPMPHAVVRLESTETGGSRGWRGGIETVNVSVWAAKERTAEDLRVLAVTLWAALDRRAWTIDGAQVISAVADPPIMRTDDMGMPGFEIAVRIEYLISE